MTAATPIRVYIGDDWIVPVNIVDTAGNAIDLTGAQVVANFWPAFCAAPVDLAAAGGGIAVLQATTGRVALSVPRSVTAVVPEQSVLQKAFPTRAQIFIDDTMGQRQTALLVAFQPVAARSTDLPSAMSVIGALTAVLSPQGPAGPSGELPPATTADAIAGLRDDVVITPATLKAALAAYGGGAPAATPTPTIGTLDFSSPLNSGLVAALGV